MIFSPAYAQGAATGGGGDLMMFLPFILIFIIFYFLMIRPQQKKMRDHQAMIAAVKRGDQVVTSGGIYGKVTKVDEAKITVEIAKDVRVEVVKATLSDVVRDTPAANTNTAPQAAGGGGFLGKLFKK